MRKQQQLCEGVHIT